MMPEILFSVVLLTGLVGAYTAGRLHEQARQAGRRRVQPTPPPVSHVQRPSQVLELPTRKVPDMANRRLIGYPDKGIKAGEPIDQGGGSGDDYFTMWEAERR